MAKITVDYINDAIEEDYENTIIELADGKEIVLRAPLRLSSAGRKDLAKLQKSNAARAEANEKAEKKAKDAGEEHEPTEDSGDVALDFFRSFITVLADDKELVTAWLEEIGDDIGFLQKVVDIYTKAVSTGEVSPSES